MLTSDAHAVLVVEDEAIVNEDVSDALRDDGFDIAQAYSGVEALAVLEERPDIRVVFTDVAMPGPVDGIRLAAEVRRRWPHIDVLITSGNQIAEVRRPEVLADAAHFVAKPCPAAHIARRIRAIVGS